MIREARLWAGDRIAAHPSIDQALALGAPGAWVLWLDGFTPSDPAARLTFYGAAATLAALALAAATFVCTMTYQSTNEYVAIVRRRYGHELRKNWTTVITSTLLAAVAPVVAMVIDDRFTAVAMAAVVYCLALVVLRFLRSVYWLRLTLFLQQASDESPQEFVVPLKAARRAG